MNILRYKASFSFMISLQGCKAGKEGVHQLLKAIIERCGNNYLAHRWGNWLNRNHSLICHYAGEPFANLRFDEIITITDDAITYQYEELTNQQVMLPNTISFIYTLLFSVKTAEQLQGAFDEHPVKVEIQVENNADTYFYEKYCPLAVDYSILLKYAIDRNVSYEVVLENHKDVYLLFNRFFNQYKAEGSVAKPYITLVKDIFEQTYDAI